MPELFDLITTDQTMPKMTGAALAKKCISIKPGIPIILLTGFSETVTLDKIKEIGIREYITKPVDARSLGEKVRLVLDRENEQPSG